MTFGDDPNSDAALARVETIRDRVNELPGGATALVGAGSAVQEDFNQAAARDLKVIIPVALLVITIILAILLQALVAPLVLIATVMALVPRNARAVDLLLHRGPGREGRGRVAAHVRLHLPRGAGDRLHDLPHEPRARGGADVHGTREGTLRALAATGPVITSAGVILAGTFAVLMTLPVTFAFNIGFMVAVGILLDTFIVRTIMVPAAVELLGDRVWWPSTAQGGGHALREHVEPEEEAPVTATA